MATASVFDTETEKKPEEPEKLKTLKLVTKKKHPPTALMVNNAILSLKERSGSSLQSIKKYISATYKIDSNKFTRNIKKYIKNSVTSGFLVQGKGALASFKLALAAVEKCTMKRIKNKKMKKPKIPKVDISRKLNAFRIAFQPKHGIKCLTAKVISPSKTSTSNELVKISKKSNPFE